jgi:hypothetical protein
LFTGNVLYQLHPINKAPTPIPMKDLFQSLNQSTPFFPEEGFPQSEDELQEVLKKSNSQLLVYENACAKWGLKTLLLRIFQLPINIKSKPSETSKAF